MNALRAIHKSIPANGLYRAHGMTFQALDDGSREFAQEMALSIFTDMINAGKSFQSALASIYLSGINHGLNDMNGRDE